MDAEELRKLSAAAERTAATATSGFDRDAWQAIAQQWNILARLREGLHPPEKPPSRPPGG